MPDQNSNNNSNTPAISNWSAFRQTYHVRLGLAVVLALERVRGSIVRRGAKVGRECLGGHFVENRGVGCVWKLAEDETKSQETLEGKVSVGTNGRERKGYVAIILDLKTGEGGVATAVDQFGGKPLCRMSTSCRH